MRGALVAAALGRRIEAGEIGEWLMMPLEGLLAQELVLLRRAVGLRGDVPAARVPGPGDALLGQPVSDRHGTLGRKDVLALAAVVEEARLGGVAGLAPPRRPGPATLSSDPAGLARAGTPALRRIGPRPPLSASQPEAVAGRAAE